MSKRRKRKYGQKHRRWLHCTVTDIDYIRGTVCVKERNKNNRVIPQMTKMQVHNSMVLGWL